MILRRFQSNSLPTNLTCLANFQISIKLKNIRQTVPRTAPEVNSLRLLLRILRNSSHVLRILNFDRTERYPF